MTKNEDNVNEGDHVHDSCYGTNYHPASPETIWD